MEALYFPAVSGVRAQQVRLDTIAHNLANLETDGFKAARADFTAVPPQEYRVARAGEAPLGPVPIGSGVELSATTRQFTLGPVEVTGDPFDLALAGPDTFVATELPDGTTAFRRSGRLSIDATGRLVFEDGSLLQPPLVLPAGAQLDRIAPDGTVFVRAAGSGDVQPIGRLELVRFPNPQGLLAAGQGRWIATEAAGQPETGAPGEGNWPPVLSGVREHSNVDLVDQMTQLIMAQRAYTANLRSLQTIDGLIEIATRLRQ
jgi:flagellar basal-body rod protein FlgG